jgi:hypothetical protein
MRRRRSLLPNTGTRPSTSAQHPVRPRSTRTLTDTDTNNPVVGSKPSAEEKTLSKTQFVSRGATAFEIFRRGSPPVETDTGLVYGSSRRTGESGVFEIAN